MKNLRLFLFVALAAGSLSSCIEDQNRAYTGPDVAEFKNMYIERQFILGAGNMGLAYPWVVTAENISLNALTVRQLATTYQDTIKVQLVGKRPSQDLTIDYSIDPTSTAVDGKSYQIVGTSGKITFKAGKNEGYIVLNVLNGLGAADPARVALIFNLQGSNTIKPSEDYKTFTYTIIK